MQFTDVVGVMFGMKSSAFIRLKEMFPNYKEIPEWCAFSVVSKKRTFDFFVDTQNEDDVIDWIIGIQSHIRCPSMHWTRGILLGKRGWMKISYCCSKRNITRKQAFLDSAQNFVHQKQNELTRRK